MLLLAHLDVVEAKREDWTRDPFMLVEENGYFYGRGAVDDKAEAAIWVDTLIRFKSEKFKPRRTIKLALTCGEETAGAFNGAQWLAKNQRDWIDAAFALNEGGGARWTRRASALVDEHPGRREGRAELSPRGDQPRRPLLAAAQGQRHLPAGRARCRGSRRTNSRCSSTTRPAPTSAAWRRSRRRRATRRGGGDERDRQGIRTTPRRIALVVGEGSRA